MKKLTYYQKKSLEFYLAHKDKQVTLISMFVFNIRLYAWIGVLSLGIILFYYFLGGPQAACIVAALIVGMLLRDIGTFRKSIRNWPLLQEIIDWDKATSLKEKIEKEALEKRKSVL
jgi:hypothetical protein